MLGTHYLIDYYHCDPDIMNDAAYLETFLPKLIAECGGTVLKSCFHQFNPQGVTGVVLIAESHCAIHTWPEHLQACVDVFSCSDKLDIELFTERLREALNAVQAIVKRSPRGVINEEIEDKDPMTVYIKG